MSMHHHMPHVIPKTGWPLKTMERVEVSSHEIGLLTSLRTSGQ